MITIDIKGSGDAAQSVKDWGDVMGARVVAVVWEATQLAVTLAKELTPADTGYARSQVGAVTDGTRSAIHGGASYAEHFESSTEEQEGTQPVEEGAKAGRAHLDREMRGIADETGAKTVTAEQGLAIPDPESTGWLVGGGSTEGSDVGEGDTQNYVGATMTEHGNIAGEGSDEATGFTEEIASLASDIGEGILSDLEDLVLFAL